MLDRAQNNCLALLEVDPCRDAARAIAGANLCLVCTGAGMSACSGFGVYRNYSSDGTSSSAVSSLGDSQGFQLSYSELCSQDAIDDHLQLFHRFACDRFNAYRDAPPHEGYSTVNSWLQNRFGATPPDDSTAPSQPRGWVFTSNVDAHHRRSGYSNVYEVHGSMERWQCSLPCRQEFWDLAPHPEFRFALIAAAAEAPAAAAADAPPPAAAEAPTAVAAEAQCTANHTNTQEQTNTAEPRHKASSKHWAAVPLHPPSSPSFKKRKLESSHSSGAIEQVRCCIAAPRFTNRCGTCRTVQNC